MNPEEPRGRSPRRADSPPWSENSSMSSRERRTCRPSRNNRSMKPARRHRSNDHDWSSGDESSSITGSLSDDNSPGRRRTRVSDRRHDRNRIRRQSRGETSGIDSDADKRPHVSYRNGALGHKARGLHEIISSDPRFKEILFYRRYRCSAKTLQWAKTSPETLGSTADDWITS